jgi:serine/threonine protein kinase
MGAILDAREAALERQIAMNVMLDGSNPDDLLRFVAEAKITGQLEHPNIVPVHELGVDENEQVFYTMKFVRGITLRAVIEKLAAGDPAMRGKYPLSALLTVFQKVCDALAFAHRSSNIA